MNTKERNKFLLAGGWYYSGPVKKFIELNNLINLSSEELLLASGKPKYGLVMVVNGKVTIVSDKDKYGITKVKIKK